MDSPLSSFIAHARSKGLDFQSIRSLLLASGWKERDVQQALVSETLDMPVPTPPDVGSAREAFLHLLSFVCLYITLFSVVFLYFTCFDWLLPDAAFDPRLAVTDWSGVRWQIAMIIVAFPVFFWVTKIIMKDLVAHPDKARSGVRRWLTYLTLLATAMALIGDAVTLVWYLLEGEITLRFILKVLLVLVAAGLTFVYYIMSLRPIEERTKQRTAIRAIEIVSWLFILGGIVWGMSLAGSPLTQRARHFDEQRVSDLQAIARELNSQTRGEPQKTGDTLHLLKPLPKTLQEVADNALYQRINLTDPETGAPYEYAVKTDRVAEICATFDLEWKNEYGIFWDHGAGRGCYQIDVLSPTQVY